MLKTLPFRREFPKLSEASGVTIIRGPRQIGKSTWMKSLLKQQVDAGMGDRVFYYTCEDLNDYQDLLALMDSQKGTRVFLLDEVTFVSEWWRAIKKKADTQKDLWIVVTGSNSYDLRKGIDLMPGRLSAGMGEIFLLPMLFDEWLAMRKNAGWSDLSLVDGLKMYTRVGGFPSALIEAGEWGKEPLASRQIYLRWIRGDVIKLGRQELFMKELMGQLVKTMGSSMSLSRLAQKTQLMSYHTSQDYLSILEQAFALKTLYAYDPETDSFRYKKDKKFYFTDPMIFDVACEWAGMTPPSDREDKLAEMIAAEWLSRKFSRLGYYSSAGGEVDFVSNRELAVEVNWAPVVHNLSKAYKSLKVAEKKVWCQTHFFD